MRTGWFVFPTGRVPRSSVEPDYGVHSPLLSSSPLLYQVFFIRNLGPTHYEEVLVCFCLCLLWFLEHALPALVLERKPRFVPVLNGLPERLSFHVTRYDPVCTSTPR